MTPIAGLLWRFASSRVGVLCLVAATLFAWHHFDKSSAVRRAVVSYVADVELAAAQAETRVLRDRAVRLATANRDLAVRATQSEKESADAEAAHDSYLAEHPADPRCVVPDGLVGVLRAN